jgi:hypothetical protein
VKRLAVGYVETARDGGQFDKAAAKLEEVWDQDQSDPGIAEALGIAYLNGADREYNPAVEAKAVALMEKSIAGGGRATFLVKHSHEHLFATGHTVTKYCAGKLSIRTGRLVYVAVQEGREPAHTFDIAASEIEIGEPDSHDGMVQIRFRLDGKQVTYSFLPRDGNAKDGRIFRDTVKKALGV